MALTDLIVPTCDNETIGFVFVKESSQMDSLRSLRSSLMSRFLESSRSEYDPRTVRKSQKKKVNRKSKCDGTAKCKAKTSEFQGHNVVSVPFACQLCGKNNWSLH